MEPIFRFRAPPPEPEPRHRCWCCAALLTTKGRCPLCDMPGLVSPPHLCLRSGTVMGDEDGCAPDFPALAADHETRARKRP